MPRTSRVALFTLVQNDPVFLRKWLRHYCLAFSTSDIYVLDHDSVGDCRAALFDLRDEWGFNLVSIHGDYSFASDWLLAQACRFQSFLLASYSVVVFAATDEFLVVNPQAAQRALQPLLLSRPMPFGSLRCQGWEVVHKRNEEPAIDPLEFSPWLPKRRWWYPAQRYSKPCVARTPTRWGPGFHTASNVPGGGGFVVDQELLLLHLHRVDFDLCLARHRERATRQWWPPSREKSESCAVYRHNLIEDPEQLERWLLCHADDTSKMATLSEIPVEIRNGL